MKNYLVQFRTGSLTSQAVQVCVEDDYIPSSDNMKKLKEMIIEQVEPTRKRVYAAPSNCGGYINIVDYGKMNGKMEVQDLDIVSISNLDI